jgi:hypothetical protein
MATTTKQSIDFTKRAADCAVHAASAQNARAREVWAQMAQYWRRRAAGVEAPLVPAQADVLMLPTRRPQQIR